MRLMGSSADFKISVIIFFGAILITAGLYKLDQFQHSPLGADIKNANASMLSSTSTEAEAVPAENTDTVTLDPALATHIPKQIITPDRSRLVIPSIGVNAKV